MIQNDDVAYIYEPGPQHRDTYDALLAVLRRIAGFGADENIIQLAHDTIDLCQDERFLGLSDAERRSEIKDVVGAVSVTDAHVREIVLYCARLTDFVRSTETNAVTVDAARGAERPLQEDDAVDGAAPVFRFDVGDIEARGVRARRGGFGYAGGADTDDLTDALFGPGGQQTAVAAAAVDPTAMLTRGWSFTRMVRDGGILSASLLRLLPSAHPDQRREVEDRLLQYLGAEAVADATAGTQVGMYLDDVADDLDIPRDDTSDAWQAKLLRKRWHVVYCAKFARALASENEAAQLAVVRAADAHARQLEGSGAAHAAAVEAVADFLARYLRDSTSTEGFKPRPVDEIDPDDLEAVAEETAAAAGSTADRRRRRGVALQLVDLAAHHPPSVAAGVDAPARSEVLLPPNTTQRRDDDVGFSEIVIPPVERVARKELVDIRRAFPAWAVDAFPPSHTHLNAMQSQVYPTAFGSEANMMVCAPTGAGKTNVAVMTILNVVKRYAVIDADGRIADPTDKWKVVYIAPMKALVREVVEALGQRLEPLNVRVAELSGDSSLSQAEMRGVHVLVATPEKWDIVSRKTIDLGAAAQVKTLIFDEVHLLHSDRGAVLEAIAARTAIQVDRSLEPIRMVALSATLPNYEDVAQFLRVDPAKGLFYFDSSYRPVPLRQAFVAPTAGGGAAGGRGPLKGGGLVMRLNEIAASKVWEHVRDGPILVFTHSRKDTVATADFLLQDALRRGTMADLVTPGSENEEVLRAQRPHDDAIKRLLPQGVAVHHAGLSRDDRSLVEDLFSQRRIRVLVATSTLAWGVNLPAHTVIIKGTKVYMPSKGGWSDLSFLDVLQMFGRAGRPGLDTSGEACIIVSTAEDLQEKYLRLLSNQDPVESHLMPRLVDALNAEISLGTVAGLDDAVVWLRYTYFCTRMRFAPRLYGLTQQRLAEDPTLEGFCEDLAHTAMTVLNRAQLARYDAKAGTAETTDLGRVAAFFNVSYKTIAALQEQLNGDMEDFEVFAAFCQSAEFAAVHVRRDERDELRRWRGECPIAILVRDRSDEDERVAKVNVLLQAYISNVRLGGVTLMSDMAYVGDESATRLSKAIHEICLLRGWARSAHQAWLLHVQLQRRQWLTQTPLRQLLRGTRPDARRGLQEIIRRVEAADALWDDLLGRSPEELQDVGFDLATAEHCYDLLHCIPRVDFAHTIALTQQRSALRLEMALAPNFKYDADHHDTEGFGSLQFLVTVEDGDGTQLLFRETVTFTEAQINARRVVTVAAYVRMVEPKPAFYTARCVCLGWLGSETHHLIDLRRLTLPEPAPAPTAPLPTPDEEEGLDDSNDHHALFGHLSGWTTVQRTLLPTLYADPAKANAVVSMPLGSGRGPCLDMVAAQFLREVDAAADSAAAGGGDGVVPSDRMMLYVAPSPFVAKRRLMRWARAFAAADALRVVDPENPNLRARGIRTALLFGDWATDAAHFASAKEAGAPLLCCVSAAALGRLLRAQPQLAGAFSTVVFDYVHAIAASIAGRDPLTHQCCPPLAATQNAGGLPYAEVMQQFAQQQQRDLRVLQRAALQRAVAAGHEFPQEAVAAVRPLSRIVAFTHTTAHAHLLGAWLHAPHVFNFVPGVHDVPRHPAIVGFEAQDIPNARDRLSCARAHILRLLARPDYVASSVLVFVPTVADARTFAETLYAEYRAPDAPVHTTLALEKIVDPRLRQLLPCGVAILHGAMHTADWDRTVQLAETGGPLVCFAPAACVDRFPAGAFRHVFIASCEAPASPLQLQVGLASGPSQPMDGDLVRWMASRAAATATVWCEAGRAWFWRRALLDPVPVLPLLDSGLASQFAFYLLEGAKFTDPAHAAWGGYGSANSATADVFLTREQAREIVPTFVADGLVDAVAVFVCATHDAQLTAARGDEEAVMGVTQDQVFKAVKGSYLYHCVVANPSAYGLADATSASIGQFFMSVLARVRSRLLSSGYCAAHAGGGSGVANVDGAADPDALVEVPIVPTALGRIAWAGGVSVQDCAHIYRLATTLPPAVARAIAARPADVLTHFLAPLGCVAAGTVIAGPSDANLVQWALRARSGIGAAVVPSGDALSTVTHRTAAAFLLPGSGIQIHTVEQQPVGKVVALLLLHCTGRLAPASCMLTVKSAAFDAAEEDDAAPGAVGAPPSTAAADVTLDGAGVLEEEPFVSQAAAGTAPAISRLNLKATSAAAVAAVVAEARIPMRAAAEEALAAGAVAALVRRTIDVAPTVAQMLSLYDGGLALAAARVAQCVTQGAWCTHDVVPSAGTGIPSAVAGADARVVAATAHGDALTQLPGFDAAATAMAAGPSASSVADSDAAAPAPNRYEAALAAGCTTPDRLLDDDAVRGALLDRLPRSVVGSIARWCQTVPSDAAIAAKCRLMLDGPAGPRVALRISLRPPATAAAAACAPRLQHLQMVCGGGATHSLADASAYGAFEVAAEDAGKAPNGTHVTSLTPPSVWSAVGATVATDAVVDGANSERVVSAAFGPLPATWLVRARYAASSHDPHAPTAVRAVIGPITPEPLMLYLPATPDLERVGPQGLYGAIVVDLVSLSYDLAVSVIATPVA